MQVGSLVILEDDQNWKQYEEAISSGFVFPVKGPIYTVRNIYEEDALRLEEIVNPVLPTCSGYIEPAFYMKRFREIQPPMSIPESLFNEQTQVITI